MKLYPTKMFPPNSITDQIYNYITERIQFGDIENGERLIETRVANSLNISRTPVREAFRRLEQEGIVERLPQGGVRVTPLNSETIMQISNIRSLLEAYAIELACEHIDESQIKKLEEIKKEAREIIDSRILTKEKKVRRLFKLNTLFHDIIDQASGSYHLARLINNLRLMILRQRVISVREERSWQEVWEEHSQLILLLKNRDKKAASSLMKMHINRAVYHAIAALEKNQIKGVIS